MPLKLDIKRSLTARSDRVKSVDLHPTEPWMLVSLYNGNVHIWNYESQQLIKTFEVCDLPVRAAKFIPRKNWIVTGSDDMQVRIFNYNTLERVHSFDAHSDYVRCIAVHPTQPIILTGSDDMSIKMWNWEKNWACQKVFEGHSHYVMQIVFNPKDNNTFASASLDRTVKVWQLGSSTPNFTLEGHEKGVNCIDYYHAGEKPYLISGADDRLVKIWDYQNKSCIQTLEGHAQNISAVAFHPELPIVLTGSEDGTVKVWHSNTYRLENTLNYGLERVWAITCLKGSNTVAIGYDEGSVLVRLGREEPAFSMDMSGKVIWAKHSEMQQVNFKQLSEDEVKDGERLPLAVKDMGTCDVYPQSVAHNSNGRYVAVCGDGEYIIYTAMALRNKCYGPGQEFVWGADPEEFAIRESVNAVKTFKKLKEKKTFKPELGAEGIYGGALLGVRSANHLTFYEWNNLELVRRIEIQPKGVLWSENGEMVAITTEESFYVLKYNPNVVSQGLESKEGQTEDGFEDAFDVVGEVPEYAKTGLWVGDCFIYTNSLNRLNYYVGGELVTLCHLDRPFYLLGYIPKENRVYLCDKELNVVSYSLHLSMLEFETAVMRKDIETAEKLLPLIPKEYRTKIAHFLEKQGFVSQALVVSTDPEHKFDLALRLGNLDLAINLARETGSEQKWHQLADSSIQKGRLDLAEKCYEASEDYGALLLLGTSGGNAQKVAQLGDVSHEAGKHNIAFTAYMLTGQLDKALETLIQTNRLPEAAFFARTYLPSEVSRVVEMWKSELHKRNPKIAQSIADPADYKNLFPDFEESIQAQTYLAQTRHFVPAGQYPARVPNQDRKLIEELARAREEGFSVPDPAPTHFSAEDGVPEHVSMSKVHHERHEAPGASLGVAPAKQSDPQPPKPAEFLTDEDIELDLENMTLDENIDYSDIREEDLLDD